MVNSHLCLVLLVLVSCAAGSPFEDGHKHYFTYFSKSQVLGLHNLSTIIKFHVTPVNHSDHGSMNLLMVDSFVQHSDQGYVDNNPKHWDLTRNFLFHVGGAGAVTQIFHHPEEVDEVVTLKKLLAGTLSMYNKRSSKSKWKYRDWETDQHGKLLHTYSGKRLPTGSVMSRRHNSTAETHRLHEKTVEYDRRGFIKQIKCTDTIRLRNQPAPSHTSEDMENVVIVSPDTGEFPTLTSTARSVVKLTARRRLTSTQAVVMEDFKVDTPQVKMPVPKEQTLSEVKAVFSDLLECIREYDNKFTTNRTVCVQDLMRLFNNLTQADRVALGHQYLAKCDTNDTVCRDERYLFLDILCRRGDEDSQKLVLQYVLNDQDATEDELRRPLFHYVVLKEPIPETVTSVKQLCFDGDYKHIPTVEMTLTQKRACLTLGALARSLSDIGNNTAAENVLEKLENKLGFYNHTLSSPILDRKKRSIHDFDYEQHHHIVSKMVLLHSLGNAGMPRSLRHIRSYLQPNLGSPTWRRAAANSLRQYTCNESALLLFDILAHEENEKVHKEAREVYLKHPQRHRLTKDKENILLSHDYTYHAVSRVRREVFHVDTSDGLRLTIKMPGIDWHKTFGSSSIGASLGLKINNMLDMKLHPLHSFFSINVDDEAWVTANIGIIGKHVDIVRAKFCYAGHIEYDLNVLKDFNINHFKDLLQKLDNIFHSIVDGIKDAIDMFKKITQPGYIKGMLTEIINFVKSLPSLVVQFVEDFVDLVKKVVNFHTDPIMEKVKQIAQRVKAFAEEIKQDALEFYHSLADPVVITLPKVGKMLKEAGDDIIAIFKDFFKSPAQSFSRIGQAVMKVRLAVTMVIDAKNKIADACSFSKGTSPFWMHIGEGVTQITGDIKDLVAMVMDKVNTIIHPRSSSSDGTNDGIMGPYKTKTWFNNESQVMLSNVTSRMSGLKTMADPFFKAYKDVMGVVTGVKTAFETVKTVVNVGKSLIQKIFGSKFHRRFPAERESGSCTDAVWPATGGDKYPTVGVDVSADPGHIIVNPVAGIVQSTGTDEITITPTDDNFMEYQVVINNVIPNSNVTDSGSVMEAGDNIGTAGDINCSPNFIHVALRVTETGKCADPSKYLDRLMPIPHWVQQCNEHTFYYIGKTYDADGTTDGAPKETVDSYMGPLFSKMQTSAHVEPDPAPPFKPEGTDHPNVKALANSFHNILSPLKNFGHMLKSIAIPNVESVFNINTMTVSKLKDILKARLDIVKRIDNFVSEVDHCLHSKPVEEPVSLSTFKLRSLLALSKIAVIGDKIGMVKSLVTHGLDACPNLKSGLAYGFGHLCTPDPDCQGMSCGVVFPYSHYHKTVRVYIRSCGSRLHLTFPGMIREHDAKDGPQIIDLPLTDTFVKKFHIIFRLNTFENGADMVVSLTGNLCSTDFGSCLPMVQILNRTKFNNPLCNPASANASTVSKIESMGIRLWMSKISQCHLDMREAGELLNDIRQGILHVLFDTTKNPLGALQQEFKEKKDSCSHKKIPVKPMDMTFFSFNNLFMVGPIPMTLGFGAGGTIGVEVELGVCFMSMSLEGKLTPSASINVWGRLGIDIGFAFGGITLTGYIMQTKFPVTGTLGFAKFPLDVTASMDMEMVPLALTLEAYAKLRLIIVTVTVYRGNIWHYSTPTIKKNIFTTPNKGSDSSPPTFSKNSVGTRSKRSAASGGCEVKQIKGRSPSDTAFILKATSDDDVSEVKMHYGIGTISGGTDVADWTEMAGNTLTMPMKLPFGVPLYWTLKASNSEGGEAKTQCMLQTYDNTPSDGRVDEDFRISSNPFELGGTVVVIDDSIVDPQQEIALGFSSGSQGNEVIPWEPISLERTTMRSGEPTELKYFSLSKTGSLTAEPLKSVKTRFDHECAKQCIDFGQNCVSFDFEYNTQVCDLHSVGEGPSAALRQNGNYKSFERLGVGQKHYKLFKNLNLTHKETYFMNTHVTNELGYESHLSSHGTLLDLTPPSPGPVGNTTKDETTFDGCSASILQRCKDLSKLPNHRKITDGSGGNTVFNGPKKGIDEKYTLSNNLIAGNWDGFYDNETGIYGYTWAAGTSVCSNDVVDYNDPHAKIPSRDQWTYSGLTSGLHLSDGPHYVTVQAVNNIIHGGALVTTVCHSTPIIVDTTPPIFNGINEVFFDGDFELLGLYYNGSDPLSNIAHVHFGLGSTQNDVKVRSYEEYKSFGDPKPYVLVEDFVLAQGVSAWPRIRLTNSVGLSTSGHASEPIIVDDSSPVVGIINDGAVVGVDVDYQADAHSICAQWENFYDSESGIKRYLWGVGTSSGMDDVVKFKVEDRTVHNDCSSVSLTHNTTYYSTIIAFNGALNMKRVNFTSNGVLVDITDPVKGWIKDGGDATHDATYSSEQALIQAVWGGFSDAESGIVKYEVDIYINNQHRKTNTILPSQDGQLNYLNEKTLELKQGDVVYTKVRGFNGAGKSVEASTNGFTLDLTPPVAYFVHDNDGQQEFQLDKTGLHLSWKFEDAESGIEKYMVSVFENSAGMKRRIWPSTDEAKDIPATGGQISYPLTYLTLENGARYFAHVIAVNKAKMSKTVDSPGVVIDYTLPEVKKIHLGPMKEDEEIEDGKLIHTDNSKMTISWKVSDDESGISDVYVAIGNSEHDQSITNGFLTFSQTSEVTLRHLKLIDSLTSGNYYYIQIKVKNGAGAESNVTISRPINVLPGNVPGVIYDGRKRFIDADYLHDKSTFAMSFAGFKSIACGIVAYEWGIGTEPYVTDIVPFTGFGIVKTNESSGFGQIDIQLFEGVKYFTTVRARTGHSCHEEHIVSTSDGIMVDTEGPIIKASNRKGHTIPDVTSWGVVFQTDTDIVEVIPDVTDPSGVNASHVCLGSYPYEDEIHKCSIQNEKSVKGLHLQPGSSVFITIEAKDNADNSAAWESVALIPDSTPPELVNFTCTKEISSMRTGIACVWDQAREHESHMESIRICLGVADNPCSLSPFENIPLQKRSWKTDIFRVIDKVKDDKIFVTAHLANAMKKETSLTREVILDSTIPTAGRVLIVTNDRLRDKTTHKQCQVPNSFVEVIITGFEDIDTGISRCEVGLGREPGSTDVQRMITGEPETVIFFGRLSLQPEDKVYATATCINRAGLSASATSEAVVISPSPQLTVTDGSEEKDEDFQTGLSALEGHWHYTSGCPVVKTEWQIMTVSWTVFQDFTPIPESQGTFFNDELHLTAGFTYINVIRVTDAIGRIHIAYSDGVTVLIEPPHPGAVRDGVDKDTDYQTSTVELSANWDAFGKPNSTDATQEIDRYEVAIGDDVKNPASRYNVHFFETAYLNTSYTFRNLKLKAKSITYYVTVRAYSKAGSFEEAYSDGIKVGFDLDISPGSIDLNKYSDSSEDLKVSWTGFYSDIGLTEYTVGVSKDSITLPVNTTNCKSLMSAISPYNSSFRSAGHDTVVHMHNLKLQQGHSYYVTVIAHDKVDSCIGVSEGPVTIDTTPPTQGHISALGGESAKVLYISSSDEVTLHWSGFEDNESDIQTYHIQLYSEMPCKHESKKMVKVMDVHNKTHITLYSLNLTLTLMYTFTISAINRAGLNTTAATLPILIDVSRPQAGTVKVGGDWHTSRTFQSENDRVVVQTALARSRKGSECKRSKEIFPKPSNKEHWQVLVRSDISNSSALVDKYAQVALTYDENLKDVIRGGLTLYLEDSLTEGNYTFKLLSAKGQNIITSLHIEFSDISAYQTPVLKDIPRLDDDVSDKTNTTLNETEEVVQCLSSPGVAVFFYGYDDDIHAWKGRICLRDDSKQTESWFDLPGDPSDYVYEISLRFMKDFENVKVTWRTTLFIEGHRKADIEGYTFSGKPSIIYRVHNLNYYKPPVGDPLHPFFTQAVLSYLAVPDTVDRECLHGEPFYDGESGLKELWVGIGTNKSFVDNVLPFKLESTFCLPCKDSCMEACDPNCSVSSIEKLSVLSLELMNLTLDHSEKLSDNINTNSSKLMDFKAPTYYISVKAVNFANQSTVVTSNAFQVDITPPEFQYMMCVDPQHSLDEPTDFIGSNNSVGAFWECSEDVSEIAEYTLQIGRTKGGHDVLNATSVGLKRKVGLTLEHATMDDGKTYYVTVTAINSAGLSTQTVCNVTIMMGAPAVSSVYTQSLFTSGYTKHAVSLTPSQHSIGIRVHGGYGTLYYEWTIGTVPATDDVFPIIKVATQADSKISIEQGHLLIDGKITNISLSDYNTNDTDSNTSKADGSFLMLEPGRCYYHSLHAVSRSHVAVAVSTQPVCVKRKDDILVELEDNNNTMKSVVINASSGGGNETLHLTIKGYNGSLLIGTLNSTDLSMIYGSAATAEYVPYITDPQETLEATSRLLHGRIIRPSGLSFYISPATEAFVDPLMDFTVHGIFPKDANKTSALLSWNKDTEKWELSPERCPKDLANNSATGKLCLQGQRHLMNGKEYIASMQPQLLCLFEIDKEVQNTPPVVITQNITSDEDQPLIEYIDVTDKEDDLISFSLAGQGQHGNASITTDGYLTYSPEPDYCGEDTVTVEAKEQNVPLGAKTYNVLQDIHIQVLCIEDPPELRFISPNDDVYDADVDATVNVELLSSASTSTSKLLGFFVLSDRDVSKLDIVFDSAAAKEVNIELKNTTQTESMKALSKLGHHKEKSNLVYGVWVIMPANSQHNKTIKFRAKDDEKVHSNLISLEISVRKGSCQGQACDAIKTQGLKRDKAEVFSDHQAVHKMLTPPPQLFRNDFLGKGSLQSGASGLQGRSISLSRDGIFSLALDSSEATEHIMILTASGKVNISAADRVPVEGMNMNEDRQNRGRFVEQLGTPLTVNVKPEDLNGTHIDIRVKSAHDNTTSVKLFFKGNDGAWHPLPDVCKRAKSTVLTEDQYLVSLCPVLFDKMNLTKANNGDVSIYMAIFALKNTPVNTPPFLEDVAIYVQESHSLNHQMKAKDAEGDKYTFSMTKQPTHGYGDLDATGNLFYSPAPHYSGLDHIEVELAEVPVEGFKPKAQRYTVTITVTAVNDPPIIYYLPPDSGMFRVENHDLVELDITRPIPYQTTVVDLGNVVAADWDEDDDFTYQIIHLNKTDHYFGVQSTTLPDSIWTTKLSDIKQLPQKKASKITLHLPSEFKGTLMYKVIVKDMAGAQVGLDLNAKVSYNLCQAGSACIDHVSAKRIA
ncbi:uncharacterized protein [Haliotis cracherodii]|uniref:uncharacterized protein n=1 Tax=Haliotis cracherodii TaxID=6455 RepID=UPI0039EC6CC2